MGGRRDRWEESREEQRVRLRLFAIDQRKGGSWSRGISVDDEPSPHRRAREPFKARVAISYLSQAFQVSLSLQSTRFRLCDIAGPNSCTSINLILEL